MPSSEFDPIVQELYYRRMSSLGPRRQMGLELRRDMWENYRKLFELLATVNAPLNLPNVWLWDMIDEFLYQAQFYRALAGQANTKPDIEFLRANPDVWSPELVRTSRLHARVRYMEHGTCICRRRARRICSSVHG